jgi:flavin reductase (DIM6/NTAB) family NADH-FMN oxidoreductase RutF
MTRRTEIMKVTLGPKNFLYPMPTVLVGANVDGKPNYMTVAYCGIVNHAPPMIEVALNRERYTARGIRENGTFSVNLPESCQAKVVDYLGLVSGSKVDKSGVLDTFYGKLKTAPMIKQCPLNLECSVIEILALAGTHDVFIGEIKETYSEKRYLTDGLPDIKKLDPILYSTADSNYWKVGEHLGKAFKIGKDYVKKKPARKRATPSTRRASK